MVKLNKIYTRTGDDGTTGLGDGARRLKTDARVEAMGSVDEANAALGVARLFADGEMDALLAQVQNDLFDLGADLAVPDDGQAKGWTPLRLDFMRVGALEQAIDRYNTDLEPLNSFILPAGAPLSAHLHLARTIVRRAERDVVGLNQIPEEVVNPSVATYLNRLSDLLFVLARHANDQGRADVLWVPGKP
ncbi:cob(I)yrinic acid a,c-diamide adenosyltransferase [Asticcacaulis sp. AND118]|uniref:cob(I)yrinic acid a,c-diamide adenosyltransferase n=1 Tax=Asticcacaulis sp. AND118 TaxID=2840468 RepID=UPI001CFF8011|nr:cob(I)yrinic acid a,c-diamide adenosyltransferase [Asticcacaulis sp. AND118]UDF03853.1 cob(I)yrinic acid a,c-diamide adenosyltransferase [Asticcacaulis sp. AND118]